jgi:hypothetical protein
MALVNSESPQRLQGVTERCGCDPNLRMGGAKSRLTGRWRWRQCRHQNRWGAWLPMLKTRLQDQGCKGRRWHAWAWAEMKRRERGARSATDAFLRWRRGEAREGRAGGEGHHGRREVGEGPGPTGRQWAVGTSPVATHSGERHARARGRRQDREGGGR